MEIKTEKIDEEINLKIKSEAEEEIQATEVDMANQDVLHSLEVQEEEPEQQSPAKKRRNFGGPIKYKILRLKYVFRCKIT